jgi:hypothetical protein
MAFFGVAMMIGMIAGSVSSTINDSYSNVIDTCQALNNIEDKQKDLDKFWAGVTSKINFNTNALNEFTNGLQNHAVQTGIATVMLKETFKIKKQSQLIGLSVFTFILVLSLLFKYFNVFPNIWNFIVKK